MVVAGGVVLAVHVGLFASLGLMAVKGSVPTFVPAMLVELVPPEPQPLPIDEKPTPLQGGGAPAAASITHQPPKAVVPKPELLAPPTPAPVVDLVVGASAESDNTPGLGQGGQGDGTGRGEGDGRGDGRGQGPQLIRGPSQAELRTLHPREAFRRRQGGRALLSCTIRLDTRLENCTLVSESPAGEGFGAAGLAAARYFRFAPPVNRGQRVAGATVQVGVEWP